MKIINFMPFPEITTQRLNLRQLKNTDAKQIFTLRSDEEVSKFIERNLYTSIEEAQNFIAKINAGIYENQWVLWAITLKNSNKVVGTVCLWNICEEDLRAEIGYELMTAYQGMGIMQEAIKAVIQYGFDIMGLNIIEAYTHHKNVKSIVLLKKSGFVQKSNKLFGENLLFTLINEVKK